MAFGMAKRRGMPHRCPVEVGADWSTSRFDARCISAATSDESIPPESNAPTGTSATIRRATASASSGSRLPPPCRHRRRTGLQWPAVATEASPSTAGCGRRTRPGEGRRGIVRGEADRRCGRQLEDSGWIERGPPRSRSAAARPGHQRPLPVATQQNPQSFDLGGEGDQLAEPANVDGFSPRRVRRPALAGALPVRPRKQTCHCWRASARRRHSAIALRVPPCPSAAQFDPHSHLELAP